MQFIDWKWKGIRIRKRYRHLLQDILVNLFLLAFSAFLLFWLVHNWESLLTAIQGNSSFPTTELLYALGRSCLYSLGVVGIVFVLLYPLWSYIFAIQRLCKMMYDSKYYLVNDIQSPNMMASKETKLSKDITYFPKVYFWRRKGLIEITFQLDGGKFHDEFLSLSQKLEQKFALSMVKTEERNGYFTYYLLSDASIYRIGIEDVIPEGFLIPLMKNIAWDVISTPNVLINGAPGGGKTFLLNILIRAFILMKADIRIGDPKNSDLADYSRIMPNVFSSSEDIIQMLEKAEIEMNNRYVIMKAHKSYKQGQNFSYFDLKPIVVFIDEYTAVTDGLSTADTKRFKSALKQIVLKGRQSGVFVILATQRPDATYLSGDVRDSLGLRISAGRMSQDGYRMTFGSIDQKLRNKSIKGRGYIDIEGTELVREFYAPWVPSDYNFLEESAKLLAVEPCEFSPPGANSSVGTNEEQAAGLPDAKVQEIIYEETD